MKKIVLYAHNGSGNHGCEALVRSTSELIYKWTNQYPTVISSNPHEDKKYINNNKLLIVSRGKNLSGIKRICARCHRSLTNSLYWYDRTEMKAIVMDTQDSLCISIGGDNYCYSDYEYYGRMNAYLNSNHNITILWGCSIEPALLEEKKVLDDLSKYKLITARETISYNALRSCGLNNVQYCPDSAFLLPMEEIKLPSIFEQSVVGINVSPLIMDYEEKEGIVLNNYRKLIRYIIENTEMNIALIPHVVWSHNNDLVPLSVLYDEFSETKRIELIDREGKLNCCQLKYVISKCNFAVVARTHASIAAYSTNVPALVTGYSVKAKGIAQDIFGEFDHYVCPVQKITDDTTLIKRFKYLLENCEKIKEKESEYSSRVAAIFDEIRDYVIE